MSQLEDSAFVPGRSCAGCTMCCKLFEIEALGKPAGTWCQHCEVEHGCRIYDSGRPQLCIDFYCDYLRDAKLGEEWKPSRSKIVLARDLDGRRLWAHVDPQRPDAWRREPFYSTLKAWARLSAAQRGQVVVSVGKRIFAILPDRDVDLGIVGKDEVIVTAAKSTPAGLRLDAYKRRKDDVDTRGSTSPVAGSKPDGAG